jgi:hypothetical protein
LDTPAYKRGQIEWALWRAIMLGRWSGGEPPAIFKTRIKRLLDLDRGLPVDGEVAAHAFLADDGGGSGFEAQYAPFDVFCLGVALDLLDIGFKQGEIVLVMRHVRTELARWFPRALARPSLIDRQNHLAKSYPDLPVIERPDRAPLADARIFLLLNRIELTEVLSASSGKGKSEKPVVLAPVVCSGIAGLHDELNKLMPLHRRTIIVIEIVALAQAIAGFLTKAPLVARGRPRKQPA